MIHHKYPLLVFFLCFVLIAFSACAKAGYEVKITVQGMPAGKAYLGFYYGDNLYVKDSAFFDNQGTILFKGKEGLPHGLYFCYNDSSRLKFDFIVTRPAVNIITSLNKPLEDLRDLGGEDNNCYREFRMGIDNYLKRSNELRSAMSTAKNREDSLARLMAIRQQEKVFADRQEQIIALCKSDVTRNILTLMRMEKRQQERNMSLSDTAAALESFTFFREHYWDYVNLKDSLVLRIPVLQQKVNEYFSTIIPQHPDTLSRAIDALVAKTDASGPLRRELLLMLGSKYATPQVADQDAVFVHLADKYFLTTPSPEWIDSIRHDYIKGIRDRMAPNIVGKKAPALAMQDQNGRQFSLDQVQAQRTLVLFYDPECEHCHKEVDAVKTASAELQKNGVTVLMVCMVPDEQKWKKYVHDRQLPSINLADPARASSFRKDYNIYATPLLFVLDQQKNIIGKAERLRELGPLLGGIR